MEGRVDRGTLITTLLLLLYGLVMLYSASSPFSLRHFGSDTHLFLRQSIAAGIGMMGLVLFAYFDYHRLRHLDDILLFAAFALTVLTVLPISGFGGGRWLRFGAFTIQPTELLKFALIIYLAAAIDRKGERIRSFSEGILPFVVILLVLAAVVINQPDLGMIIIYGLLTMTMLFLGGARLSHLGALSLGSLPLLYLAIYLAPYRLARILAFFNPGEFSTSSGYQIIQSLVAIGSGGIFGRGLGESQAKLFHLPQAHNDFIFAVTAEELGLIGALVLVGLFAIFTWRAFVIAGQAPDRFGRLLALGIGCTVAGQALLNLGVTVGLLPVTGLTLPFVSNGGTSLIVKLSMVGVLLNISKQRG